MAQARAAGRSARLSRVLLVGEGDGAAPVRAGFADVRDVLHSRGAHAGVRGTGASGRHHVHRLRHARGGAGQCRRRQEFCLSSGPSAPEPCGPRLQERS